MLSPSSSFPPLKFFLSYAILCIVLFLVASSALCQDCSAFFVGGRTNDEINAVEVDNFGNVYSAGITSDTTYFSNSDEVISDYELPGIMPSCAFIMKTNSEGELLWFQPLNFMSYPLPIGNSTRFSFHLMQDGTGGVIVGGWHFDNGDFLGVELPNSLGYASYLLAHLNTEGELQWIKHSDEVTFMNHAIVDMARKDENTIICQLFNEYEVLYDDELLADHQVLVIDQTTGEMISHADALSPFIKTTEQGYHVSSSLGIRYFDFNHQLLNTLPIGAEVREFQVTEDLEYYVVTQFQLDFHLIHYSSDGEILASIELPTNNFKTMAMNEENLILVTIVESDGVKLKVYDSELNLTRESQFGLVLPNSIFSASMRETKLKGDTIYAVGALSGLGGIADFVCTTAESIDNGDGYQAILSVEDIAPVSVQELENTIDFVVYPNPCNEVLKVQAETATNEEFTLIIYNSIGEKIYSELIHTGVSQTFELNVTALKKGIYSVQLKSQKNGIAQNQLFIKM